MRALWVVPVLVGFVSAAFAEETGSAKASVPAEAIEFFENSVRPLLVSACGDCHGAKKQWGGLRVDSREALLKGGDTSPAIVPGKPDASLLIAAVRRSDEIAMPPESPLKPEQIAILEKWVQLGAPWPEETTTNTPHQRPEDHWAFKPISRPVPPQVMRTDWPQTPLDQFILSKLEQAGLCPSPAADRRTYIRRVTYTLTGLPPTPEEVDAFVQDTGADAERRLIDRLLESPQYGEHWARHWLDLSRYADTKGYVYAREETRFVHSWVYRDWVVQAIQNDLPYDQFLLLQIAADQVAPNDLNAQAAMGFLTIGRRFLGNTHDIIDDRIDVLGRTTMGLTIGCARCHDHKYDPIPAADYYSLYGVLQNCNDQLLRLTPAGSPDSEFEKGLQQRLSKLEEGLRNSCETAAARNRSKIVEYLVAQTELEKYPELGFDQILSPNDLIPPIVIRWETYLRRCGKEQNPIFTAWHRFAALPAADFEKHSADVIRDLHQSPTTAVHPRVASAFTTPPESKREVAERYGQLFESVEKEWQALIASAKEQGKPTPDSFPDPDSEALRQVLYGPRSPCELSPEAGIVGNENFFDSSTTTAMWKLQKDLDEWLVNRPESPAFAVRVVDRQVIHEPRLFRRGNAAQKGDEVPRQLPLILAGSDRKPFQSGSGRLELAQGIVSTDNPLTARVWVNRIWQYHFGVGLVPTSSDFGIRAPEPAQLALLDWLARKLIDDGWSTKSIHRLILLSATYQQQSDGPEDPVFRERASLEDPQNQLFWKMNRHRLSFEEFRDSILRVTGELNLTVGGRASPLLGGATPNQRRTLYGYIDREFLPSVYRIFDFANPDLHIPARSETTVSQQALFAMNHPFIAEQARVIAEKVNSLADASTAAKIEAMYQWIHQRPPSARQLEMATAFLNAAETPEALQLTAEQQAWQYGYGAISDAAKSVTNFQPLPYFNRSAWQGGEQWPDKTLGWAQLTAEGGHPGNDHNHAVVRRWTAPRDMKVSIQSDATHENAPGNGIRCWIFSSQQGVLNQFTLHQSSQKLLIDSVALKAGDTLDFVVDINGNLNSDDHRWTVTLQDVSAGANTGEPTSGQKWNSQRDFAGDAPKLLKPWEQLSQVLLLSNEFLFVD